jgi:hypothetical protein
MAIVGYKLDDWLEVIDRKMICQIAKKELK